MRGAACAERLLFMLEVEKRECRMESQSHPDGWTTLWLKGAPLPLGSKEISLF